jgi:hypothetical protein
MALIDDIKNICDRLAPLGWREFLKMVTGNSLDIQKANSAALAQELTKDVSSIDRSHPGLEDLEGSTLKAIAPGEPSRSLLYHALASPLVVRDHNGNSLAGFATPSELDLIENYIFSLAPVDIQQFVAKNGGSKKVAVVVFSYEYRPAAHTVDGRHADLTFSRTGIARIGTARAHYVDAARGFSPEDDDNPHNFRVIPAKFSAWLAVKKKGAETRVSPILDNEEGQASDESKRDFWVPVHKLFPGAECASNMTVTVELSSTLFNLKIQRIHAFLGTTPLPNEFPYVIKDTEIGDFSTDKDVGPGWLSPKVRLSLVEPAIVNGTPVTFPVSKKNIDDFAAFDPSKTDPNNSGVPSYVHARTKVENGTFEDLNDQPNVVSAMKKRSYDALHYVDYTGEGWITAKSPEISALNLKFLPAYALVSAPDFFPGSGQFELSEWSRSSLIPKSFKQSLWSWGNPENPNSGPLRPTPLSEIRLPANLQLPGSPFDPADSTISALVGRGDRSSIPNVWPMQPSINRSSSLPDDAAGVFAPGWDVSRDKLPGPNGAAHLAGYGLGSPFPEDSKLCAALSTFWPAVAPDVFRTFVTSIGNTNGTVAPLTDEEIGQVGSLPWDGISGPKEVMINGESFVEFASFLNADYVRQAVQNRFSIRLTAQINAEEYESRMLAACRIYSVLANLGDIRIERNNWLMFSFRAVSSGDPELQKAQAESGTILKGNVYAARLCRIVPVVSPKPNARTDRMPLVDDHRFFSSPADVTVISKRANDPRFGSSRSEP